MSDHKPPRMARDERTTLSALLRYQRESFVRKVTGLDDDASRRAGSRVEPVIPGMLSAMKPGERIRLIQESAGMLSAKPWTDIQLSLESFGFQIYNEPFTDWAELNAA